MRPLAVLIIALLLDTAILLPAIAAESDLRIEYFEVQGHTPLELLAYLDAHGPGDGSGHRFDALTHWRLVPRKSGSGFDCRITMYLPRASSYQTFGEEDKQEWDAFTAGLEKHERVHVAITQKHCRNAHDAQEPMAEVAARIRAANAAYDRETGHDKGLRARLKGAP